jgi:hypothetical protein
LQCLGRHPHVVALVGCITADLPVALITQFCPKRDLLRLVRNEKKNILDVGCEDLLRAVFEQI